MSTKILLSKNIAFLAIIVSFLIGFASCYFIRKNNYEGVDETLKKGSSTGIAEVPITSAVKGSSSTVIPPVLEPSSVVPVGSSLSSSLDIAGLSKLLASSSIAQSEVPHIIGSSKISI